MASKLARFAGSQVARQAIQQHTTPGGALDLKFGLHLLARDRNVPIVYKMLALGLGGVLTLLLNILEIPLESMLVILLPVIGFGAEMIWNGLEMIVCPILFAALMLPHLAPKQFVQAARGLQAVRVTAG
jgi:hypothetical protein